MKQATNDFAKTPKTSKTIHLILISDVHQNQANNKNPNNSVKNNESANN